MRVLKEKNTYISSLQGLHLKEWIKGWTTLKKKPQLFKNLTNANIGTLIA